jgi:DNA-binding CsgD family transcriptional regulator
LSGYSVIPPSSVYIRLMSTRGRPRHPDILTPREWEVLALIQRGASNDEIAKELGVTERTAKYHVSEILSKLGVSSRDEAALALGERRMRPVGRPGVLGNWALLGRIAALVGAAATLAGVAILGWGVLKVGGDSNAKEMSLADVYSNMVKGATQDGKLLHVTATISFPGTPASADTPNGFEYWIDAGADVVREKFHSPGEALGQQMGNTEHIYSGRYIYYPADSGSSRQDSDVLCKGNEVAVVGILLGCESGPYLEQDVPTVNRDASWEGKSAVAVEWTVQSVPINSEPTDTPNSGTSLGTLVTTYLDPHTFLPMATVWQSRDVGIANNETRVFSYHNEFIDRKSVALDFLNPRSIGYGLADAQVQLSNLNAEVPVYWFGEDVTEQGNFPELLLRQVSHATPYEPAKMFYSTPDNHADVTIALWTPADWASHVGALQEPYFADPSCTTETKIDSNGYTAHVFPLPDYSAGVPPAGTCASRLLNTQVFNWQGEVSYFAYVDLGNVVVEFRPHPHSEYDHSEVVQTLLSQLRAFAPN